MLNKIGQYQKLFVVKMVAKLWHPKGITLFSAFTHLTPILNKKN